MTTPHRRSGIMVEVTEQQDENRTIATVVGIERHCVPRKIIAQCDECGDQYLGGDVWNSAAENEAILRKDGWSVVDGAHTCPDCGQH